MKNRHTSTSQIPLEKLKKQRLANEEYIKSWYVTHLNEKNKEIQALKTSLLKLRAANADLEAQLTAKEESEASLVKILDAKRKTIHELQDKLTSKNAKIHKLKTVKASESKSSRVSSLGLLKVKEKHAKEVRDLKHKLNRLEDDNKILTERTISFRDKASLENRVGNTEQKIDKIEKMLHRRTLSSPESWLTTTALTNKAKKRKLARTIAQRNKK